MKKKEVFLLDKCQGVVDFVNHTSLIFRNEGFRYNTKYLLTDEHFEKKILQEKGKLFCLNEPLTIHRIRNDGKNLSHRRFSFTRRNLMEFFEINGFKIKSIVYLAGMFVMKYFPDSLVWIIISIMKLRSKKIDKATFNKKYPNIAL